MSTRLIDIKPDAIFKRGTKAVPTARVSVLIPVYNEAESLPVLYRELRSALDSQRWRSQIVFVDDGSDDGTAAILRQIQQADGSVVFKRHKVRRGKSAALNTGFRASTGDIIVTMDGDLQDDPSDIGSLVSLIEEGNDVVCGWRAERKDSLLKKLPSRLYNRATRSFSGVKVHDFNCGFKAYRRSAIAALPLYGDMHRYTPVLAAAAGYRITEKAVHHRPRTYGRSKFGARRLFGGLVDLLTVLFLSRYGKRPLQFLALPAAGSLLAGVGLGAYVIVDAIFSPPIAGPVLVLAGGLLLAGVLFLSLGLVGELMVFINRNNRNTIP